MFPENEFAHALNRIRALPQPRRTAHPPGPKGPTSLRDTRLSCQWRTRATVNFWGLLKSDTAVLVSRTTV